MNKKLAEQIAMRMNQLALDCASVADMLNKEVSEQPVAITVRDMKFGAPFTIDGRPDGQEVIWVKVRPVGQLCNSRLIGDILTRGDALVVRTDNGNLHIVRGDAKVGAL